MRGDSYQLQGQQGAVIINSASGPTTGDFRWFLVLEDATKISSITGNILLGGTGSTRTTSPTALSAISLPAGFGFGGTFKGLTVSSGTILAYTA